MLWAIVEKFWICLMRKL